MLHKISYIILVCCAALLFAGCDGNFFSTTLDDDIPDTAPQMAIHAFITEGDSLVLASVTRTYGPLDDRPANELLSGAEVELYEDGNLLLTLEEEDIGFPPLNYFSFLSKGLEGQGKTYELVVRHPEFGEARATQIMPVDVPVKTARFKRNLGVNEEGDRLNGITISLDDPAGVDNYYEVSVYRQANGQGGSGRRLYIETVDPTIQEGYEGWTTGGNSLLIDGTSFDGQSVNFDLLGYSLDTADQTLVINWRNISREMYRYSRTLYLVKDQVIEENPFASPVSVFSNINGGLGVFGSRTEARIEVK